MLKHMYNNTDLSQQLTMALTTLRRDQVEGQAQVAVGDLEAGEGADQRDPDAAGGAGQRDPDAAGGAGVEAVSVAAGGAGAGGVAVGGAGAPAAIPADQLERILTGTSAEARAGIA
jgi:hypothetical protein